MGRLEVAGQLQELLQEQAVCMILQGSHVVQCAELRLKTQDYQGNCVAYALNGIKRGFWSLSQGEAPHL